MVRPQSLFSSHFLINPCSSSTDAPTARDKHMKLIDELKNNANALYLYTDGSKSTRSGSAG
jgi:hypothetical protein